MIKLEDFSEPVFNAWKRNMQFGMKYHNIFYTVMTDFATCADMVDVLKWAKDEDFCRDYLLNCLSYELAEFYSKMKTPKEIWDALDARFKEEEGFSKMLLINKFLAFTFDESKQIFPQISDLENLFIKLKYENILICDEFLIGTIIFKLPSTWHSFKIEMYHKKEQVKLDQLKHYIRVEEENMVRTTPEIVSTQQTDDRMITNSKLLPKSHESKPSNSAIQLPDIAKKIKKFKGKCYNCNKWGHSASVCRQPKKAKFDAAN